MDSRFGHLRFGKSRTRAMQYDFFLSTRMVRYTSFCASNAGYAIVCLFFGSHYTGDRVLRNFSGYPISGLWNIAMMTEVSYVSCPPDFIDQEDGLST